MFCVWPIRLALFPDPGHSLLADKQNDGEGGDLEARIAAAKKRSERGISSAEGQAESRGWAIGIEFVGAVLISGFIGWLIDRYAGLGTAPWAMIVMLLLGFAAGTRRAMQTSAQFDSDPGNDGSDNDGKTG